MTRTRLKIVVFGLAVSSSWGNGHATLWRGLGRGLAQRGHTLVFFERDQPFYRIHRDAVELPGMQLHIYPSWEAVQRRAAIELAEADVGIVTSFCPDGRAASDLVLGSPVRRRCYYDLDTPVTLERLERGEDVPYLPAKGLADFDLVLSYTGGRALLLLQEKLGARRTAPLYGSVDPVAHAPGPARAEFAADLSYLGTYSADRQPALDELLLRPAALRPERQFVVGGAQYPETYPWRSNVRFAGHVPPDQHPSFYASSPLTLNVTRAPMAASGYCPSARFFEAASCGVPVLSDCWPGLEMFFEPGREVLLARDAQDALAALDLGRAELERVGRRARERTLAQHTAFHRALELERVLLS